MASSSELPDDSTGAVDVAAAANAELESILSVTSHDLRGHLMTIQGFAQELELSRQELAALLSQPQSAVRVERVRTVLNKDVTEAIAYLKGAAAQIEAIVGGLQRMSNVVRMPFRSECVDMNAVVAAALQAMKSRTNRGNFHCDLGSLPRCRGDAAQLQQLFLCLLDNATRWAAPDRAIQVTVTGALMHPFVTYCVADDGPGIPSTNVHRIFDLFRKGDPPTDDGQDLGLALARHIAIRHSGTILAESTSAAGSRIFVSLPRVASR
jgi:signal transduction histidine kinase